MSIPNTQWFWRDGPEIININNDIIIMMGGWNSDNITSQFVPGPSTSEIWISFNAGIAWTLVGDAPWIPRHWFGNDLVNGIISVYGGDPYATGTPPGDLWTCDINSVLNSTDFSTWQTALLNWTEVTNDWGADAGDRILFAWCYHNGERYIGGGCDRTTTIAYNDLLKWNSLTNKFEYYCDLPIAYFMTGTLLSTSEGLKLCGGTKYDSGNHSSPNIHIWTLPNGSTTWFDNGLISEKMTGIGYAGWQVIGTDIIFSNGWLGGVGNQRGIFKGNFANKFWERIDNSISSHARGRSNVIIKTFYIVAGNLVNSVKKISKN